MWLDNASEVDILLYEPYANVIADISKNPIRRSARYSYNFQPSSDRCKSDWQQAFTVSFWNKSCYHTEIPRGH